MTLTIESTYEIVGANVKNFSPLPTSTIVETMDVLTLIDEHRSEQTAESWLEWACLQIDRTLADYGQPGRVSGGYVAGGRGTLFTLSNSDFPTAAVCRAIARALEAQQVKSCPGAVMVAWQ